MIINKYPYTNLEEQNLDWLLLKIQELETRIEALEEGDSDDV